MFGEDIILGYKEASVDNKGRIVLPKFSGAETGEKIAIVDNGPRSLKLYAVLSMKKTIDALNKNCSPDEFEKLQALNDRLQLLYYSYLATSNVDSQRRINIPDQIIRSHGFTDSVIMQGCGTNLTIYSDKETYEDYVRKLRATK